MLHINHNYLQPGLIFCACEVLQGSDAGNHRAGSNLWKKPEGEQDFICPAG
jgi:hypothetical protein